MGEPIFKKLPKLMMIFQDRIISFCLFFFFFLTILNYQDVKDFLNSAGYWNMWGDGRKVILKIFVHLYWVMKIGNRGQERSHCHQTVCDVYVMKIRHLFIRGICCPSQQTLKVTYSK